MTQKKTTEFLRKCAEEAENSAHEVEATGHWSAVAFRRAADRAKELVRHSEELEKTKCLK
jgi:hypothetical protein